MVVPHGPAPISAKGQVTIPAKLLAAAGLVAQDNLWFELNDDGSITVMPHELVARIWEKGKSEHPADVEDP